MKTNRLPFYPIELTVHNKMDYVPVICQTLSVICDNHGFDNGKTQQIIMAVEEAASNVIAHAFAEEEDAVFTIIIQPVSIGIKITIRDKGIPYNPENTTFNEEQMTGFGNFMIGKLMDNVIYKNLGNDGKELTLVKYFSSRYSHLLEEFEQTQIPKDTPKNEVKPDTQNHTYTYRNLNADDTLEIARCAYEAYGYSYPYEHIYFPERIETLNKSGDLISMIAEADTSEIAAHLAFMKFEHFTGLYELGVAMTKQKFRGANLFSNLMDYAMGIIREKDIQAYYAQCVTTHIYSQKSPIKLGMKPTALLLSYVPENVNFKKIAETNPNRSAVMIVSKITGSRPKSTVYIPEKYVGFAKHIYVSLGENHSYVSSNQTDTPEIARTSLSIAPKMGMGKLIIHSYGKDFIYQIKKHLQQIRKEKVQMLETLFLINQPDAVQIIEQLELLGFIFSGLLPGTKEGDLAVMQYLNGIDANTDNIHLVEEGLFLNTFIQSQLINM